MNFETICYFSCLKMWFTEIKLILNINYNHFVLPTFEIEYYLKKINWKKCGVAHC